MSLWPMHWSFSNSSQHKCVSGVPWLSAAFHDSLKENTSKMENNKKWLTFLLPSLFFQVTIKMTNQLGAFVDFFLVLRKLISQNRHRWKVIIVNHFLALLFLFSFKVCKHRTLHCQVLVWVNCKHGSTISFVFWLEI